MARPLTISRDDLIQRLVTAFRALGYENSTLAELSEHTGLAKAALYHHFPGGKVDMAAAVLESVGGWMVQTIFMPLQGPGKPRDRLVSMTTALDRFYDGGSSPCLLALFSVGEAHQHFHAQIQGGANAWIESLSKTLRDAGLAPEIARARAEDGLIRIQGALILARALQSREPFSRLLHRLPDELLAGTDPSAA